MIVLMWSLLVYKETESRRKGGGGGGMVVKAE